MQSTAPPSQRRTTGPPDPQPELLDSPLWPLLYRDGRPVHGTWLPRWVIGATRKPEDDDGTSRSEARARVLAELLYWFQPSLADQRKRGEQPKGVVLPRARAKVYDGDGLQWLALSAREIGRRQLISGTSAVEAVRWLARQGLLLTDPGRAGDRGLRLDPRAVARVYHRLTGDPVAAEEFLDGGPDEQPVEWTNSRTQASAYQRTRGVTVHNCLVKVIGGRRRHFLARFASQLLYCFGDREGRCRARKRVGGNLWWVASTRWWAAELAASESAVESAVAELVEQQLVLRTVSVHRFAAAREAYRFTHLRPNVPVLLERVRAVAEANPELYPAGGTTDADEEDDGPGEHDGPA